MRPSTKGYLTITEYDNFLEAYSEITLNKIEFYKSLNDGNFWSNVFNIIAKSGDHDFSRELTNLYDNQFKTGDNWWNQDPIKNFKEKFEPCYKYASEFNQKFAIIFTGEDSDSKYYLVTFGKHIFLIFDNPHILVELYKDYSNDTIAAIKGQISKSDALSLVPKDASNISINSVNDNINSKRSALDVLKQEMSDVKDAKTGELATLQAEIDAKVAELEAKKQAMLEILEQKKHEMQAQMEQLENQLFVLESEIYAIRCFLGEVVNFTKIKTGIGEPSDTPIVLFQKVRYLDEEMGKLSSLYDFEGDQLHLFEKFISVNNECLETFCPSKKCISLVRCTKSGFHHRTNPEIANMLEAYEAYHGKTIGILIRDGENLYIGWTDEEKVNIKEDMFFIPGVTVHTNDEDADEAAKHVSDKHEIVSRYFVFSILQGALENSDIIKLGGEHRFSHPDNMIIYSAADNWIADNKYGSLADLLDKYSKEDLNKLGDEIIVVRGLRPDWSKDSWAKNDRGIGYANRTHDVSTSDGEIHKINHILSYEHYYIYYIENGTTRPPMYVSPGGKEYHYRREVYNGVPTDEEIKNIEAKDNITIVEHGRDYNYEYFISLFKDLAWYKTEADYKILPKANFQIYTGEYINMTFFNSVWITYIIQTKNIGKLRWCSKGVDVDYAYVIKYLKIMREHLLAREAIEASLINEHLPDNTDVSSVENWQVLLSEWKFSNNIHKLGKRAAKQFAKYIINCK